MRIIFVIAVLFVIGSIAGNRDIENISRSKLKVSHELCKSTK